jgi:hypothetical protein
MTIKIVESQGILYVIFRISIKKTNLLDWRHGSSGRVPALQAQSKL